jgi:dATP pyrophosphohydrolase
VLVFPYRKVGDSEFEYAVFRRSDAGYWQGMAGGGEGDETPLEAARREALEEAGLSPASEYLQLDAAPSNPVTEFRDSHLWGDDVYVIPQYCFGVLVKGAEIVLSHEHTECRWLDYPEARSLLKWDGDRLALWELDRRVRGLGPRD